jgi:hypothetical protein
MKKLSFIIIAMGIGATMYGQEQDSISNHRKWVNLLQIGQMFEDNAGITGRLSASWTSGVEINKVFAGVELGFNDYGPFNFGSIAVNGKYKFFEEGVTPYGYGLLGYGHPFYVKDNEGRLDVTSRKGGLLYGIGMGLDVPIGKVKMLFQLGYKFQKASYSEPNYYYYNRLSSFAPGDYSDGKHTTRKMNRVEFKIGVAF